MPSARNSKNASSLASLLMRVRPLTTAAAVSDPPIPEKTAALYGHPIRTQIPPTRISTIPIRNVIQISGCVRNEGMRLANANLAN